MALNEKKKKNDRLMLAKMKFLSVPTCQIKIKLSAILIYENFTERGLWARPRIVDTLEIALYRRSPATDLI